MDRYGTAHLSNGLTGEEADAFIASTLSKTFDLRPAAIVRRFGLKNPIYEATAAYGHMGRKPYKAAVPVRNADGSWTEREIQFFGWEKLDAVDKLKELFE